MTDGAAKDPLPLLAYVHLRNIHRSTGAGRTARQIVEHLSGQKEVQLRVLADEGDRGRIVPLVGEPWSEYRYHTFGAETTRQQARWFFTDRPYAEEFWPEAKVVFCTAESYVPVRAARLVVTAHDAGYFDEGAHRRDRSYWTQQMKWRLLFRKLERRVDMVHTVSEFSAERLGHFFPRLAARIRCVPNGVTPHFFRPVQSAGEEYLERAGLRSRPFVLVPGGLHFRKNAELILQASPELLRRYPELEIVVVNHSDAGYAERAKSVGPRFRQAGFVSDEALRALYGAAQVVWFPSRYEGFGLPVVEAMACGAAVVASRSSAMPEVAGEAAVLLDPAEAGEHVEVICALLGDDRRRAEMGARGRVQASKFTWGRCAAMLKGHFESLL